MYTQVYVCLLIFHKGFLQRNVDDIGILIMFLLIVTLDYRSFSHHNRMTSFFPLSFKGLLYDNCTSTVKGGVKNQLLQH
jgi:hypothetical protein